MHNLLLFATLFLVDTGYISVLLSFMVRRVFMRLDTLEEALDMIAELEAELGKAEEKIETLASRLDEIYDIVRRPIYG